MLQNIHKKWHNFFRMNSKCGIYVHIELHVKVWKVRKGVGCACNTTGRTHAQSYTMTKIYQDFRKPMNVLVSIV